MYGANLAELTCGCERALSPACLHVADGWMLTAAPAQRPLQRSANKLIVPMDRNDRWRVEVFTESRPRLPSKKKEPADRPHPRPVGSRVPRPGVKGRRNCWKITRALARGKPGLGGLLLPCN